MRRANCAGTRNGYVSGGAPVGEDFPRTRIREEKARYGGVLERSGASRRNRWRRAPWILRRRLWFHLATGWPGGSSVAIPGHFTNDGRGAARREVRTHEPRRLRRGRAAAVRRP